MSVNPLTLNNPFAPIPKEALARQLDPIQYEKTVKEYFLIPYSEAVDGNEENIVIKFKPVLKNEYDLKDYIESFADEVGIQNILRKLSLSGDKSILNQTGREALCPDGGLEPVQDYSNVPKSKTEAFNAVAAGVAAFDNLPDDLKGKMSMAQFAELVGQEELDKYIAGIVAKNMPKEEDK